MAQEQHVVGLVTPPSPGQGMGTCPQGQSGNDSGWSLNNKPAERCELLFRPARSSISARSALRRASVSGCFWRRKHTHRRLFSFG